MRTIGLAIVAAGALVSAPFWLFMGMVIDSQVALWTGAVTQIVGGICLGGFAMEFRRNAPVMLHDMTRHNVTAGWPHADRRSVRNG